MGAGAVHAYQQQQLAHTNSLPQTGCNSRRVPQELTYAEIGSLNLQQGTT